MDCRSIVCDANNLYEAYLKTIRSSKWKETTQKFVINYLRNIFKLLDELENQTYKPGEEGAFTLNERGKIRPITTLQPRDRVIRHIICDDILMPKIENRIIYDNGASVKGRGMSHARKRFEVHFHKACIEYGDNEFYVLLGDFTKFYDNVIHEIAIKQLLDLFEYDEYLEWILNVVFDNFKIDVSYMSDKEFEDCLSDVFNRLEYRKIPKKFLTGERFMAKSLNIGDQLSQIVGVYYPNRIDTYVKYVKSVRYYGRYMDDFYIFAKTKEELESLLVDIIKIANELGIHLNTKKTRIIKANRPFRYLQIRYHSTKTGHLSRQINPKRVHKMEEKIKKLSVAWKRGEIDYETVEDMFKSWMGSFYKILSKMQRKRLIDLFETSFDKRIEIRKYSGKWKMIIS